MDYFEVASTFGVQDTVAEPTSAGEEHIITILAILYTCIHVHVIVTKNVYTLLEPGNYSEFQLVLKHRKLMVSALSLQTPCSES